MKASITIVTAFLFSIAFAQPGSYDGDRLTDAIGKSSGGPEVAGLETTYHCEMTNPAYYSSITDGMELIMKDGALNEIRLYKNSLVYGTFKDNLPKALRFGMSSGEVKALLGKPTVNYSSTGYMEFQIKGTLFACGFEGGKLSELTLSKSM